MFLLLSLAIFLEKNMRPNGANYRPTLITSWQRKSNRSAVVERIHALSKELSAIQAEMHTQLTGPVEGQPGIFLEDANAVQALKHLKAELDQLRRILWFYLEEVAEKPLAATEQQQQSSAACTYSADRRAILRRRARLVL
jgi:hypothetical protein